MRFSDSRLKEQMGLAFLSRRNTVLCLRDEDGIDKERRDQGYIKK